MGIQGTQPFDFGWYKLKRSQVLLDLVAGDIDWDKWDKVVIPLRMMYNAVRLRVKFEYTLNWPSDDGLEGYPVTHTLGMKFGKRSIEDDNDVDKPEWANNVDLVKSTIFMPTMGYEVVIPVVHEEYIDATLKGKLLEYKFYDLCYDNYGNEFTEVDITGNIEDLHIVVYLEAYLYSEEDYS